VHLAVDEARTLAVADLLERREDGCRELARARDDVGASSAVSSPPVARATMSVPNASR
jgi:hypothetical protein